MIRNCSESVPMEMIELVRKLGVISGGRSVWFCRKCSHKGEFSVTVCKQLSAGHLLSPKTVMQRSFRIDRDDRVPSGPCSNATSQNYIHPFSLAKDKLHIIL